MAWSASRRPARVAPAQETQLKAWLERTLPRTTCEVGAYIERQFGVTYESRSGLVALLHRLGFEHRKPAAVPSKMDPGRQPGSAVYEKLLNSLPATRGGARPQRCHGDRRGADHRPRARQYPRSTSHRHHLARGPLGRRHQHDCAAANHRGALSAGSTMLDKSRQAGKSLARPARLPNKATIPPYCGGTIVARDAQSPEQPVRCERQFRARVLTFLRYCQADGTCSATKSRTTSTRVGSGFSGEVLKKRTKKLRLRPASAERPSPKW